MTRIKTKVIGITKQVPVKNIEQRGPEALLMLKDGKKSLIENIKQSKKLVAAPWNVRKPPTTPKALPTEYVVCRGSKKPWISPFVNY